MQLHVVGHTAIKERFYKELPYSLLLTGPEGIGKRRLASYLAQQHAEPFDILTLGVEDTKVKKAVSIQQVRECGKFISTRPFSNTHKVVVIDATVITDAATQALLRMLEEPPASARFIITTSGSLPLTVLSRCTRVQVPLLSEAEVTEVLELQGFPTEMAKTAARLSEGSVGKALAYMKNSERRRAILSVLHLMVGKKLSSVVPLVRKFEQTEVDEAITFFEDVLLAPFGRLSFYTAKELALGASFTPVEIEAYLKLLQTPLKPSLKWLYLGVRMMEAPG